MVRGLKAAGSSVWAFIIALENLFPFSIERAVVFRFFGVLAVLGKKCPNGVCKYDNERELMSRCCKTCLHFKVEMHGKSVLQ